MEASSSTSTIISTDPASLRAAALSTLKRRKPILETPAPIASRPPPPSDSFQLDYGQEDKAQDAPMTTEVSRNKEKTPIPEVEGNPQMREEGEISEEEEPPPPPKQLPNRRRKLSTSPRLTKSTTPEPRRIVEAKLTPPPPGIPNRRTPASEVQLSPLSAPALMDRISNSVPDMAMLEQVEEPSGNPMNEYFEFEPQLPLVGPNRVRPGLDLNQDEYDTVKDIILDLLGWSVPFDHLVECGLSKEVVYYVFNELELRLPDTFDTSGIVPYTPEPFTQLQQSALMPPPPIPEKQRHGSIDSDMSAVVDSLTRETTPPTPMTITFHTVDSPSSTDLHDIERQRRQELVARKAAVQASRKLKQRISVGNIPYARDSMSIDREDVVVDSPVPTETVEDFLNSLGPVQTLEAPPTNIPSFRAEDPPAGSMDVDQIREHSIHEEFIEREGQKPDIAAKKSAFSDEFSMSFPVPEVPSSSEVPLVSVGPPVLPFSQLPEASPSTPPIPPVHAPRRGVKRPVASDFVDFDPAPKRHESNNRIERVNGSGQVTGITRRLNSSVGFHNINSRRCVIDLSDSEDDGEEVRQQPMEDQVQSWRDKRSRPGKFPSPAPIKPTSSGDTSPAALLQKEHEIRKMRELIAQREEETRLRKLALAKLSSFATPIAQPALIKVEEPDVVIATTTLDDNETNGHAHRNSEPVTPPFFVESSTQSAAASFIDENNALLAGASQEPVLENQGLASETQEAKVALMHDMQTDLQKQDRMQPQLERSVDADQILSPSTQRMGWTTAPPVHQEQDARKSEILRMALNNDFQDHYSVYRSPFESYPLLFNNSQQMSSDQVPPFRDMSLPSLSHMYTPIRSSLSSASHSVNTEHSTFPYSLSSSGFSLPDLKPLKLAALAKSLDPFKRLCQYEIPGGGTCRDEGCEDVHLSRLEGATKMDMIELSDEDTAEYLFNVMPNSWLLHHNVTSPPRIFSALQQVRRRTVNNPLRFEDRVTQALESLGSPPT